MGEQLSFFKDSIIVIAAIIGSYVALVGLSTWKRQLKGQTDHELARRILVILYRYRDAINGVRHPAMLNYEFLEPPEERRAAMTDAQLRFYGLSHAYQNRWEKVQNQRVELHAALLEAEAIWGTEIKMDIFPKVFALEWELQTCIRNYLTLCDPDENEGRQQVVAKRNRAARDIQYDSLEKEGDEYSKDLTAAIGGVEAYLKPKLGRE